MRRRKRVADSARIFVLDTNILIYDPYSLFKFKEHDVYIPMSTLEELDEKKNGLSEVGRNSRAASRYLDDIVSRGPIDGDIINGYALKSKNGNGASGTLILQTSKISVKLPIDLPEHKVDNDILLNVFHLQAKYPEKEVILVSKDINLRIKALAIGLKAEDYHNDMVLEDSDVVYSGFENVPLSFWDKNNILKSWTEHGSSYYIIKGSFCKKLLLNQFICDKENDFCTRVIKKEGDTVTLETVKDFSHKNDVWGIKAKSKEQNFALNVLMDNNLSLVTLLGQAGSGKTILTLAAALHLVFDKKLYNDIIFTRATISIGEDIGFLPGTEEEKMTPWMGALEDNLEALINLAPEVTVQGKFMTKDFIMNKIKIKSINFMRGRTFINKFLIIDEAQNLTPKQMKTLITRAGPGTKIVCLGNVAQIDASYLTEYNCGISYLVERMKGWEGHGHVTMMKVERSKLAEYASQVL